ncbi:MAG: hypothetical protein QOH83_2916 [Solirubrobacteraceae bacterium]|jgi:hypothetical protein|nr:hypothetical protein [Solirubrobacteraceae bacterium]
MLRNLLTEIMRRHLWPIPVVALLVAVAAPLLFLKPAPQDASPASADAATAPAGQLPARAQRLLDTSNVAKAAARRPARNGSDPFEAPSHGASAAADTSATATGAGTGTTGDSTSTSTSAPAETATTTAPLPDVVTNSDGSPENSVTPGTPTKTTTPTVMAAVTTRFGQQYPAPVQHSIARLRTFVSDGNVVAIFVKYSPARDKAVFAIAPSTVVTGNVACRRKEGVCRYVDIAVGKHVRLETSAADGTLVSSRLDVVRIDRAPPPSATSAANSAPANGSCLLAKLLTLTTEDQPLSPDAC